MITRLSGHKEKEIVHNLWSPLWVILSVNKWSIKIVYKIGQNKEIVDYRDYIR